MTVTVEDESNVKGWLLKKGSRMWSSWKSKWIMLVYSKLYVFEKWSEAPATAKHMIDLRHAKLECSEDSRNPELFGFRIVTEQRKVSKSSPIRLRLAN